MKVVVLSTSYPRDENDAAGIFVSDAVSALRAAGVSVEVVSPASFRHFGVAYGAGIPNNLRRRPWLVLALPPFLLSFALAARRAARDADLVHGHWLPSALPALLTRRPFVLQLWGTDAAIARRAPRAIRRLVRRARVVVVASESLARDARRLGAADVRVIPAGVRVPEGVAEPEEPPHVLYVGRLSQEKGILDFLEATAGLRRVIVGDGPLRARIPEAVGFVPPGELTGWYERASVVCVPSRREGYGMVAREAMAHARPVVMTRVGGLADAAEHGASGFLVEAGDTRALRSLLERLLGDAALRRRVGAAARERAIAAFSPVAAATATLAAYADALAPPGAPSPPD